MSLLTICIGAGPAGLTAAHVLTKQGWPVLVLEADPEYVGGIARTVRHNGFLFDVGGHRFFSKSKRIERFWLEVLADDFLLRPRKSRILYDRKFFSYPLKPAEAFRTLGWRESMHCAFSYALACVKPKKSPANFSEWVSNRFGRRLFEIFFRTYTEKVWGMPCTEISADWAAQRIQGVSPLTALLPEWLSGRKKVKSLIDSFYYPRRGPGMMWEAVAKLVREQGGDIQLGSKVTECRRDGDIWRITYRKQDGSVASVEAKNVISSMPLRELMQIISPAPASRQEACQLRYRDFIMVALIMDGPELFADNWIYVHEQRVKVGRIQNFRAASPEMVPDTQFHCYGMEYFCFDDGALWESSDEDLLALAKRELAELGFGVGNRILDGYVVRQPKAYPVYDKTYQDVVSAIRRDLERNFAGMHLVGRNGMHKYNNQDHSMMTAMLVAENIMAKEPRYNAWNVNQDAEYLEAAPLSEHEAEFGLRIVPGRR